MCIGADYVEKYVGAKHLSKSASISQFSISKILSLCSDAIADATAIRSLLCKVKVNVDLYSTSS